MVLKVLGIVYLIGCIITTVLSIISYHEEQRDFRNIVNDSLELLSTMVVILLWPIVIPPGIIRFIKAFHNMDK